MPEARLGPSCCYTATSRPIPDLPVLRSLLHPTSLLATSLWAAAVVVNLTAPAMAETAAIDMAQEETIERILELRAQLQDLVESLPPELRDEVERRWRQRQAEPPAPTPPTPSEPTPAATAPAIASEPAVEPTAEAAPVATEQPGCGGFHLLDTDDDGLVSGGDRQWRFLRVWFDNGDGEIDSEEIESLLALGVRSLDTQLRFYNDDGGGTEDVDVADVIELRGIGKRPKDRRSGVLVVDADRLERDGVLRLEDPEGRPASGYEVLSALHRFVLRDGRSLPILCVEGD